MSVENPINAAEVAGNSFASKVTEAFSKPVAERGKIDLEAMREESRQEALKKLQEIRG